MNQQQGFWRDAKPSDANKEPPMKARFSNTGNSNDWQEGDLFDIVLIDDSEEYKLIYESKKSGWHFCQVWEEYKKSDKPLPKIVNLSELEKESQSVEETVRQKVKVARNGILFSWQGYWIELNRIKDKDDLIEWISHLLEKDWVDSRMLARFIKLVCEQKNWEIYKTGKQSNE